MDGMKEMGIYDNSMIIITSDHGEMLGEQDLLYHGLPLYEPLLWVPLIIKYPKGTGDRQSVVEHPVQLVDLLPTILDLLDLPIPEEVQGEVLDRVQHPIVAEFYPMKKTVRYYGSFPKQAALYKDLKFMMLADGKHELYDLKNDPREQDNLASEHTEIIKDYSLELQSWYNSITPLFDSSTPPPKLDKDAEEKLRALGYVQ